jgi:hypothetical protein
MGKAVPQRLWSRRGERKYSSYSFMTSALGGVSGQRHATTALYPRERTTGIHCTGGWVGLRASLDTEVRGKTSCLCRGSYLYRPGLPVRTQTLLTELPRLLRLSNTGIFLCYPYQDSNPLPRLILSL